jgi:hypothetical protein
VFSGLQQNIVNNLVYNGRNLEIMVKSGTDKALPAISETMIVPCGFPRIRDSIK